MSKPRKREICMAELYDDSDWTPNCFLEKGHGPIHVSPGSQAITIWNDDGVVVRDIGLLKLLPSDASVTENEQHESDDRQDDQDRPQHDDSDTRAESFAIPSFEQWNRQILETASHITIDGVTRDLVTPEIQAVLDALPGAARFIAARSVYGTEWSDVRPFEEAWRAYLDSIEPPKPAALPELWINIYDSGFVGTGQPTRKAADEQVHHNKTRVGVIHLRADGTTEMVRT